MMFVDFSVKHFVENELYFVDAIKWPKHEKWMATVRLSNSLSVCVCATSTSLLHVIFVDFQSLVFWWLWLVLLIDYEKSKLQRIYE